VYQDIKEGKGPATSLYMSSEIEKPIAGPGEAIVKVKYFGINRMDLTQRGGLYQVPPQAGKILGVEFSGVIESLGEKIDESENESSFNAGDAVFGLTYGGK
jgi:NADPH:quinone reductase-like Zn-dependent oxidoreductase